MTRTPAGDLVVGGTVDAQTEFVERALDVGGS
jgi:hypothetical protein